MQTIYYTTRNFIRHTGNLVDLNEFRRRQALALEDSLARKPQPLEWTAPVEEEPPFQPQVLPRSSARSRRTHRFAWTLDACASLGVVVMTLAFALRIMA